MKNLNPKIAIPALFLLIAAALFFVLRGAGVGVSSAPPPIAGGGLPASPEGVPAPPGNAATSGPPINASAGGGMPPMR